MERPSACGRLGAARRSPGRRARAVRSCSDPTASANPRWPDWPPNSSPAAPEHTHPLGHRHARPSAWCPFGAFSHLVEIDEIGKPAALLRAARASLTRAAPQGDLLLIVDDAHDLDLLSATLVYQLALDGAARMIVTARADAAPAAIAALWTDRLLDRIDIEPPGGATDAGGGRRSFSPSSPRRRGRCWTISPSRSRCRSPISPSSPATARSAEAERLGRGGNPGARRRRRRPGGLHGAPAVRRTARRHWATTARRQRRTELVNAAVAASVRPPQRPAAAGDRWRWTATHRSASPRSPTPRSRRCGWATLLLAERLARAALDTVGRLAARLALASCAGLAGTRPRSRRGAGGSRLPPT